MEKGAGGAIVITMFLSPAMRVLYFVFALVFALPAVRAAAPANEEFPLRKQYIDVAIYTTADLARRYSEVVIVDVRSKFEYDTLRVKDALILPITDRGFVNKLRKLREESGTKPIVFYCNGKTCRKSYDAVIMALSARIANVFCYDAGINDWAKGQPERTALLGKSPIRAEDLIGEKRFKERLLEPKEFAARVGPSTIVLDVRDRMQRDNPLFPMREERAQLDETERLGAIIEEARRSGRTLLIYDAVGKQVEWLQYHLEVRALKSYYFMKGGAQGYYDATLGKVELGGKKEEKKRIGD